MKKALRSILALLTALILACTGGPFRPVTSEAADSKAPYLRVTGITDQSLTVELVAGDSYTFKAFGGAIEYNADILQMASFSSSLPNASYDGGDSAGYSYYVDVYCSSGNWNVSAGTVLCRWVFKSRTKSGKLACLATYPFEYETEWTDNLKSWNTGTVLKTSQYFEHWYDGGKVTKAATCTQTGVKTFTCTHCGVTRTEAVPALGHAWDEGKVTQEVAEFSDGIKTYTCTRCGTTRTESIPATPENMFENLRDYPEGAASAKSLDINWEPRDGKVAHDGSETFKLRVEVTGGNEPYTYAWYRETTVTEEKPRNIASRLSSKAQALMESYQDKGTRFSARYKKTIGKKDSAYAAIYGEIGSHSTSGRVLSTLLAKSETPYIDVTQGDAYYYCIITDAAGRTITTRKAYVGYKLYIETEPESLSYARSLLEEDPKVELKAAGGTEPYEYRWYEYDETRPYTEWKPIDAQTGSVLRPGDAGVPEETLLACVVTDAEGETAVSRAIKIERSPYLRILGTKADPENAEPGRPYTLSAYVAGESAAKEAYWTLDGRKWPCGKAIADTYDGQSCYRYDAEVTGDGLFEFHIENEAKESNIASLYMLLKDLPPDAASGFGFTTNPIVSIPELNRAIQKTNEGLAEVGVLVRGGEAPYTIEWLHAPRMDGRKPETSDYQLIRTDKLYQDGHYEGQEWFDSDEDLNGKWYRTTIMFPLQEYMAVRVTDKNGKEAWEEGIESIYLGSVPYFSSQPSDVSIPYEAFGKVDYTIFCQARTTLDSSEGIKYMWQKWDDRKMDWYTVSDYSTEPGYHITSPDQCGKYRCIARDVKSGSGAWSDSCLVRFTPSFAGVKKLVKIKNIQYGTYTFQGISSDNYTVIVRYDRYLYSPKADGTTWTKHLGNYRDDNFVAKRDGTELTVVAGMYKDVHYLSNTYEMYTYEVVVYCNGRASSGIQSPK